MRFDSRLKRLRRGKKLEVKGVRLRVLVPCPLPLHRNTNLPWAVVLVRETKPLRDSVGEMWLHGAAKSRLLSLNSKTNLLSHCKAIPAVLSRRRRLSRYSLLSFATGGATW